MPLRPDGPTWLALSRCWPLSPPHPCGESGPKCSPCSSWLLSFLGLIALGVLSWRLSPRPATVSELLLFGGTAVAGLISTRHISLFAVAATPIVARHLFYASIAYPRLHAVLTGSATLSPTRGQRAFNSLLLLGAFLALWLWVAGKAATNEAAIAATYPVAAVDFLFDNDLAQGRLFNSYGWGGYLIWRKLPVFIDSRADVYGDDFTSTIPARTTGMSGGARRSMILPLNTS
jgi:hypothetical protein